MNPPDYVDPSSPPPSPTDRVTLDSATLKDFPLTQLGFPATVVLREIVVTPLLATVLLDLSTLPKEPTPADLYPAIRRLALRLDEDCKQMGLVVPVVVVPRLPDDTTADLRGAWQQIDADTDLNTGEFAVRLPARPSAATSEKAPTEQNLVEALMKNLSTDTFHPLSLVNPVRPRNDDDYREALYESSAESRSSEHTRLLLEILYPNWDTPDRARDQILELALAIASEPPKEEAPHEFTS